MAMPVKFGPRLRARQTVIYWSQLIRPGVSAQLIERLPVGALQILGSDACEQQ